MLRVALRRAGQALPLLLGLTLLGFLVLHLAPGDPAALLYGGELTGEELRRFRAQWGLDRPVPVQYLTWLAHIARGDLGRSYADGRPVLEGIAERIPATLVLTVSASLLAWGVGSLLGFAAAARAGTALDHASRVVATVLYAIPNFWLGLLLIIAFSVRLGWLPTAGLETLGIGFSLVDRARHLLLPATVLAVRELGAFMRFARASLLERLGAAYIRTARAKGLPEGRVVLRHALRNALIPLVSLIGLAVPRLLGGAVVVETVFAWPGLGRLGVEAALARNYAVLMGNIVVAGVMVLLGSLAADLTYAWLDPRVRHRMEAAR